MVHLEDNWRIVLQRLRRVHRGPLVRESASMNRPPATIPLTAWLLGLPGLACLAAGVVLLAFDLGALHPLLGGAGAGLALLVSAIALLGSAAFPLVLRRLAERDLPAGDQ